ncbi:MAG TPA: GNAT family N-acetyltransferase [Gammaproteobacteria bacterium]
MDNSTIAGGNLGPKSDCLAQESLPGAATRPPCSTAAGSFNDFLGIRRQPADEFELQSAATIDAADDIEPLDAATLRDADAIRASSSTAQPRAASAELIVETIRDEDGLRALEPEWIALENEARNTLPFRTAAWALAWWQHLRRQCSAIEDHLALRAVRTADGKLVGVAPLMITVRPGRGFLRTRCLQFIGADTNVTELRGGLWAPEYEQACMQALKSAVTSDAAEWDWMIWNGIPVDSAAAGVLSSSVKWKRYTPYYTLRLDGDWPTFKSRLRRNVKESLRKCYNSLKRDGLDYSLDVVTEREEMEGALHDFFRLHAQRASTSGSIRHPNAFATANSRTFLVDLCERLSERGQARVFRLRVGGSVVATRVGFLVGGTLYLYFSGYERAFGKYSVMTTLLAEIIQYAYRDRVASINLSSGNDVSKTRWAPQEWVEGDGVTVSPRPLGRFAYAAYRLAENTVLTQGVRRQLMRVISRAKDAVVGQGTIAQTLPFVVAAGMF